MLICKHGIILSNKRNFLILISTKITTVTRRSVIVTLKKIYTQNTMHVYSTLKVLVGMHVALRIFRVGKDKSSK